MQVGRTRTDGREWARYYEAADRVRAIVVDPFVRYAGRVAVRERLLLIASGVFMAATAAAFLGLVGP